MGWDGMGWDGMGWDGMQRTIPVGPSRPPRLGQEQVSHPLAHRVELLSCELVNVVCRVPIAVVLYRARGGGGQPDANPTVADHVRHRRNDLDEEPAPVLRAAAVLVRALAVGRGREELIEKVSVRGVDLDAVKARLGYVQGGGR